MVILLEKLKTLILNNDVLINYFSNFEFNNLYTYEEIDKCYKILLSYDEILIEEIINNIPIYIVMDYIKDIMVKY